MYTKALSISLGALHILSGAMIVSAQLASFRGETVIAIRFLFEINIATVVP